jgi:hypothetical protein
MSYNFPVVSVNGDGLGTQQLHVIKTNDTFPFWLVSPFSGDPEINLAGISIFRRSRNKFVRNVLTCKKNSLLCLVFDSVMVMKNLQCFLTMTPIFRLASVGGLKMQMDPVTGTHCSTEIISIH